MAQMLLSNFNIDPFRHEVENLIKSTVHYQQNICRDTASSRLRLRAWLEQQLHDGEMTTVLATMGSSKRGKR